MDQSFVLQLPDLKLRLDFIILKCIDLLYTLFNQNTQQILNSLKFDSIKLSKLRSHSSNNDANSLIDSDITEMNAYNQLYLDCLTLSTKSFGANSINCHDRTLDDNDSGRIKVDSNTVNSSTDNQIDSQIATNHEIDVLDCIRCTAVMTEEYQFRDILKILTSIRSEVLGTVG